MDKDNLRNGGNNSHFGGTVNRNPNNPMLIDAVVEYLMELLPDEDLQNSRQVCRLWNQEAIRQQDKRHTLEITSEAEAISALEKLKNSKGAFKVSTVYVRDVMLASKSVYKLLLTCAPTMSSLSMLDCKVPSASFYQKLMRELAPGLIKCDLGTIKRPVHLTFHPYVPVMPILDGDGVPMIFPKMKEFHFVVYTDFKDEMTFLSDILKSMPNLRQLNCGNLALENPSKFAKIEMPHLHSLAVRMLPHDLNTLTDTTETNMCSCCNEERALGQEPLGEKHLRNKHPGGLKNQHIEMLLQLDLKLTKLVIWNVNLDTTPETLRDFIQTYGPTLKELELRSFTIQDYKPSTEPAPNPFACKKLQLSHLKTLGVDKSFVRNVNEILSTNFPNLSQLEFIFHEGSDWSKILPNKIMEHDKLEACFIEWIDPKSLVKLASGLAGNITSLDIQNCSDEIVSVVIDQFSNLTKLQLEECEDPEKGVFTGASAFTGISEEDLDMLYQKYENSHGKFKLADAERFRKTDWFIGAMDELEYFILKLTTFDEDLINKLALFGLSRWCPALKCFALVTDLEDEPLPKSLIKVLEEDCGFVYIVQSRQPNCYLFCRSEKWFNLDTSDEYTTTSDGDGDGDA